MPLTTGSRVGLYEIIAPLGVGGMGEVYRARDTRLKRDVALKVLPDTFAQDTDRLARFQREAELLATLNHPHIAGIYGLEESEGVRALALELVEGPTLADRIAQGPVPLEEALPIAQQIAQALEAAHEAGIIHRDLKPANIKLRPDGTVKVLDFGLAKALEPAGAMSARVSLSPTITSPAMTLAGMILGTAAYMSPEQTRGKPVDKRADIWAFGCVLFEVLAGSRAFDGDDVAETVGAVIHKEPAWTRLPTDTPAAVRMTLRRCLEKDPKQRIRDIGDVRLALSGTFESALPQGSATLSTAAQPAVTRRLVGAGVAVLLAVAAIAAAITWAVTRPAPARLQPMRFAIVPPAAQPVAPLGGGRQIALSPDGSRLAYIAAGTGRLMVRAIDRLDVEPLRSVTDARAPFWSPDSKWIGFFDVTNEIVKVPAAGGPPIIVCGKDLGVPRGASWGADNTIVFATNDPATGLWSVSASGGEPKVLTKPDTSHGEDHIFPFVLPGGGAVLFTITRVVGASSGSQIAALNLKTGERKTLISGSQAEYVGPSAFSMGAERAGSREAGYLVYGYAGTLNAVRFNAERLDVLGEPVPVVEQVRTAATGAVEYSVSRTGVLMYLAGGGTGAARSLVWVDRSGRETPIKAPPRAYVYPRLSPDGSRVAVSITDQENDVWVWDLAHETLERLTVDPGTDAQPLWTPDGSHIVFHSNRAGSFNLFWQLADGTGAVERLTSSPNSEYTPSISPDGKQIVMMEQVPGTGNDLTLFHVGGKSQPEPLLATKFNEDRPEISPDGHWLAYSSNESGRVEVYVRPFPNVQGGHWRISVSGGARVAWARTGKELFYAEPAGAIMFVPVQTGSTFSHGNPQKLFDWPTLSISPSRTYDVSGDGQRFLMIKEDTGAESASANIVAVLNWTEELKQRVPTR